MAVTSWHPSRTARAVEARAVPLEANASPLATREALQASSREKTAKFLSESLISNA
jgi:hypothetical protein